MKGPSWLVAIPHYDIIRGSTVDALLGICRQLLKLLLDTKHNKELWYLGHNLDELDIRLCSIKPPSEINKNTAKYQKHQKILER